MDALSFSSQEYTELTESLSQYFKQKGFSWHEAEDLVQEVLMQLCRKHAIAEVQRPRALAFTIARALGVDKIRRSGVRRDKQEEIKDHQSGIQKPADTPLETMVIRENRDFIRASIDKCEELDRGFFIRTILQGESTKEAMADLGIDEPEERWKKRRTRFIEDIREKLADNP